jgi:hypothetical protein
LVSWAWAWRVSEFGFRFSFGLVALRVSGGLGFFIEFGLQLAPAVSAFGISGFRDLISGFRGSFRAEHITHPRLHTHRFLLQADGLKSDGRP